MREIRSYSEFSELKTFEERFEYLKLNGTVGQDTYGFDRYLNQRFYRSAQWREIRNQVISRDDGCDLGVPGYDINTRIYIHHMNPIYKDDIVELSNYLMNPEFLISCSFETHNAIHYSDDTYLKRFEDIERKPNDTCPWRG